MILNYLNPNVHAYTDNAHGAFSFARATSVNSYRHLPNNRNLVPF